MSNSHWLKKYLSVALVFVLASASAWAGQVRLDSAPARMGGAPVMAISLERAGEIALEQVGSGSVIGSEYKAKKDGRVGYKVLVLDGNARVEVVVDGVSGQVMSLKRKAVETVKYPKGWTGQASGFEAGIDAAKAREIVLAKTGGGTVVDLEQEFKKDGRVVYEVEVVGAERKYEVKLDGRTGAIIEYKEKMPKHLRTVPGRG